MKTRLFLMGILSLALVFGFIGCGSKPKAGADKSALDISVKSDLETALSAGFDPIDIAENAYTFEFGGGKWIAKIDGVDAIGGTFTEDTATDNDGAVSGSTLTLTQTHTYSAETNQWVEAAGDDITLVYTVGDPSTLLYQPADSE